MTVTIEGTCTEELRRSVVAAIAAGATQRQVIERFGVPLGRLRKWCDDAGVRPGNGNHPAEVRERALALAVDLGCAAATEAVGVPKPTIYRWCRAAGVTPAAHPLKRKVVAVKAEVLLLLAGDELSGAAIARRCDISECAVSNIARAAGIELRHRAHPVVLCDLAELDQRIEEISARAERTVETADNHAYIVGAYRQWCEDTQRRPRRARSVAAYLRHQAVHGCSNRPGSRGEPVGWTVGTLEIARSAILLWLESEGLTDCRGWRRVASAMEEVRRTAHPGTPGCRVLTGEELSALADVPMPTPTSGVLRVRLTILAQQIAPDLPDTALTRALAAVTAADVSTTLSTATVQVRWERRHRPRVLTFTHTGGGLISCGHCIVAALAAAVGPGDRLAGTHSIDVAARTTGIALRRARQRAEVTGAPDGIQCLRLLVWADPRLAAWCRTQAYTATAATTGYRNDELRLLDLTDLATEDGRYWELRFRKRKNDQRGEGIVLGIDAACCPETIGRLVTWRWVRGGGAGPLFPSPRGGPLSKDGSRSAVTALALTAGVERERFGVHSFRHTVITELFDRGVFLSAIAGRLGITDQVAFDYFELRPKPDTPELLGLGA